MGAVRLLRRAADRVEGYAAEPSYGINAAGLVAWARAGGLGSSAMASPGFAPPIWFHDCCGELSRVRHLPP
jgi:uncharacterized protein